MPKFKISVVSALLLASTSLVPAKANTEAPQKKAPAAEFTIEREGQPAVTFELSDCEIHTSNPRGSVTVDTTNHVATFRGDTTISARRDGKQVFFMSVKNAIITLKTNTSR